LIKDLLLTNQILKPNIKDKKDSLFLFFFFLKIY